MTKAPAIGIDLGTTYSCVGVFQHGKVEIIANDQGNRTTPSYVSFTKIERLIGDPAKNQVAMNSTNTVFDVKRLIGTKFDDEAVQNDMQYWPFKVIEDEGRPKVLVGYKNEKKTFLPEEISSMVLTKMKETAESYLGNKVTDVVITVPAYFNDSQRQATKDAGTIAGLNVLRILNEPTAAAIAYGMDKKISEVKNVLVYDIGGGTFDVSIVTIGEGIFQVRATAGETHLGGEDFNNRMIDWIVKDFRKKHSKDLTKNKRSITRLRTVCERAKRSLSVNKQANIEVDSLIEGIDYCTSITKAKFEDLCIDLFKSTIQPVEKALKDAKIAKAEVDDIILVGGSTRIPKIQALLQDYFEGKELNKSINPDEAVAYGAALQAASLPECKNAEVPDLLLIDVIPLSLGIEITAGRMIVMIPRNSTLPIKQQRLYTTSFDSQQNVSFKVYEGERGFTKDNNFLGEFILSGIPPAPKGVPEIQVTFDVDNNGILNVSAVDSATGIENKVTLKSDIDRHSHKDIERMIRDAEKFRKEDDERRKRIQLKNSLEHYVYNMKSTIQGENVKDKISNEKAASLYKQCQETIKWLEENHNPSAVELNKKQTELEKLWEMV